MPSADDPPRPDLTAKPSGRARVLIERIWPQVDGGVFAAKRIVGDELSVEADLVVDGHDLLAGDLLIRHDSDSSWSRVPLSPLVNDRWCGSFPLERLGSYRYAIDAWVDAFATWQHALAIKADAGQALDVELMIGCALIERGLATDATDDRPTQRGDPERDALREAFDIMRSSDKPLDQRLAAALEPQLSRAMRCRVPAELKARSEPALELIVERDRARFSSWYEMFPRSCGLDGQHGTFADAERMLPYVAELGFDVLYLPPIHPIGRAFRKGPNNTLDAGPTDPGSPWAIGDESGGHKAIHPQLGTLEDFRRFRGKAEELGLEIALDVALQVSPDHPYVREHPEWFRHRPDGTIQYAENPPKKYQDIYPFDFECDGWPQLWQELCSIFLHWIDHGVRIFRVDNPHTKSLRFWQWCIRELRQRCPEVILLAEAFTRPKLMYGLAKRGFSQSYTYFTWRRTRHELTEYLEELAKPDIQQFFRPSFWPNTPDILPEHLQFGGRPTFIARLVLAATMTSNYGIYGPAFELMEHVARPGAEEYVDNEKYQLRSWDIDRADSLRGVIARLNRIRRDRPALQRRSIAFHRCDNDQLICYSRRAGDDVVLIVVNLDPHHRHGGWIDLDLDTLGIADAQSFQMHDLLSGDRYLWSGARNYVEIDPHAMPAQIFRVRRRLRREHDFDYFE